MRLEQVASIAATHRRAVIAGALLTTCTGLALIIDRPKGTILEWLAIPLLGIGAFALTWAIRSASPTSSPDQSYLVLRLMSRFVGSGRVFPIFPLTGLAIVLADLAYNMFLSANGQLLTEDIIVLMLGCTFVAYPMIPGRFARERDFTLAFFVTLNCILVLPLLAFRLYYQDFERSVDFYSWVALAPETSGVLSLVGVSNFVHPVAGATAPGLTFTPRNLGTQVTVVITTACSGIYSFGIFASALAAFVFTEYEKVTRRVWGFLGVGLLTAYGANVLRMTVIILVGYYTDSAQTDLQNMLIAHSYAGWLIFLVWISVFWSALFRFLPKRSPRETSVTTRLRDISACSICRSSMSPAIPGSRCGCGKYFHKACAKTRASCPACGRIWTTAGMDAGASG